MCLYHATRPSALLIQCPPAILRMSSDHRVGGRHTLRSRGDLCSGQLWADDNDDDDDEVSYNIKIMPILYKNLYLFLLFALCQKH